MKITLICTTGVSIGLLVRRIRKLAADDQLEIISMGFRSFDPDDGADAVLIGPIGSLHSEEVKEKCSLAGMPYMEISQQDYEKLDAPRILEQIKSLKEGMYMTSENTKTEIIAMKLISSGGEARSKAMEAIFHAKEGDLEKAEECLDEAEDAMIEGHTAHTQLLFNEANQKGIEINVLLIHSDRKSTRLNSSH